MATIFKRRGKGPYIVRWTDHEGRRPERSSRTTDLRTAQRLAAKWEGDSMLRAEGVIDPMADLAAVADARPINEHLKGVASGRGGRAFVGYEHVLLDKGDTPKHVKLTIGRCERVLATGKITRLSQFRTTAVRGAIREMMQGEEGLSAETANHCVRAIKAFARWLWRERRTRDHALVDLAGFNAAADRRLVRRDLDEDELCRLVEAAENGPFRFEVTGTDRAWAYRLAINTGFRASELASLTPQSFDLNAPVPTATVEAGYSKRRRRDMQPIRADLAGHLRDWLRGKPAGVPVIRMPKRTAEMLRFDLAAARAAWLREAATPGERDRREKSRFLCSVDEAGRVCDFHSLRHSYISILVRSGASVKVVQELARHSTPMLTIGRYAHVRLADVHGALAALPGPSDRRDGRPLRATGT